MSFRRNRYSSRRLISGIRGGKESSSPGEDAQSEVSEWEMREREERDEETRRRDAEMGAEVAELEFLPARFAALSTVEEENEE